MHGRMLAWVSPDGCLMDADALFCAVMGADLPALQGMHLSPAEGSDWSGISDGTVAGGRLRCLRPDGQTLWMEGAFAPIRNADGQVDRIVACLTNISDWTTGIDAMLTTLAATASGDLSARIPRQSGRELGAVIDRINADLDGRERLIAALSDLTDRIGQAQQGLDGDHPATASASPDIAQRLTSAVTHLYAAAKTIDALSFNANRLALGVSVQAARAGQDGQSLTQLAQEVRSLAHAASEEAARVRSSLHAAECGIRNPDAEQAQDIAHEAFQKRAQQRDELSALTEELRSLLRDFDTEPTVVPFHRHPMRAAG
ncbi:hypothetical protein [Aestuariivita boseongensis]|uniref:hypothetical protein n=1 Tax=Aestuariivita boseongensis TaxID=1470562 RepID=UPI00155DAE60|nr:hypothetical protein [Aestuariivita boseongensis]